MSAGIYIEPHHIRRNISTIYLHKQCWASRRPLLLAKPKKFCQIVFASNMNIYSTTSKCLGMCIYTYSSMCVCVGKRIMSFSGWLCIKRVQRQYVACCSCWMFIILCAYKNMHTHTHIFTFMHVCYFSMQMCVHTLCESLCLNMNSRKH